MASNISKWSLGKLRGYIIKFLRTMNIHFRQDVPVNTAVVGVGTDEAIKMNADSTCALHLHSRGGANNDPELTFSNYDSAIAQGDNLGVMYFAGTLAPKPAGFNVAGGFDFGASVLAEADGDWTINPPSSDVPGRLFLATTPAGSSTLQNRMTIRQDGDIGIGTMSPQSAVAGGTSLHVHGDGGGNGAAELHLTGEDTDFDEGDNFGAIFFGGTEDGDTYDWGASIVGEADADNLAVGSDFPGRLRFMTTPDGSSALTDRMTIDSAGLVSVGSPGISTTKSTTNGTVNLGTNNNNNGGYDAETGDMAVRSGQSVATINTTALANGGVAYWIVASSKILATDVIVATCNRDWCPVTVYGVTAGSFTVAVTNNTGGTLATSTTLTLNWVAL